MKKLPSHKTSTSKKKGNKLFHHLHILLLIIPAFVMLFFISSIVAAIGDNLLLKDNILSAKIFYQMSAITNPFNSDIHRRLLATQIVEIERKAESEETTDDNAPQLNGNKAVLGATTNVPVVMYHYVRINPNSNDKIGYGLSVTPDNFKAQMDYLQSKGYHTVTLDQVGAALFNHGFLPSKPIVLTFDDGYADYYTVAYPILKSHGFNGVNFIITGLVGVPGYLTWDQINEMKKNGISTFGAHTVNHIPLAYATNDKIIQELTDSKKTLQSHLGYPINWCAYPFGSVNATVAQIAKQVGYTGCFGTNYGTYQSSDATFTLPRVRVNGPGLPSDFAAKFP